MLVWTVVASVLTLDVIAVPAQPPALPIIGYLSARSPDDTVHLLVAFRRSLGEGGFVEGKNVTIEYQWARGQYDRLPALAAELVRRPLAVLVSTGGDPAAVAAKNAAANLRSSSPSAAIRSRLDW